MTDAAANLAPAVASNAVENGIFARSAERQAARAPATARAISLTLVCFLCAAIAFTAVTPVRELARAQGTIVPSGRLIKIEHMTGGIVAEVTVQEGTPVAVGDVLARLESPDLKLQVAEIREALWQVHLQQKTIADLLAHINPSRKDEVIPASLQTEYPAPLASEAAVYGKARHALHLARQRIVSDRVQQLDETLATLRSARAVTAARVTQYADQVARLSQLAAQGHVSQFRLSDAQDRLGELRGEQADADVALARKQSERQAEQARWAENALTHREALLKEAYDLAQEARTLTSQLAGLQARLASLVIRAPSDGVIQSIAFPAPGEVISPDTELFELLPSAASLVAEIKLKPQDIGHVYEGAQVKLKLQTFDFRRFGGITGEIKTISPTIITDPDGTSHFRAVVTLASDHVGEGNFVRPVRPGMEVAAEIQTNSRTVLEYLLKPLDASLRTALSER
jgi:HlyD family type I secretion membrane fusion protein